MEREEKIGESKPAEEVLRDQNEELKATVEELRISEEELASQLEELQQSRDALRLKNFVFDASIAANSIADMNGVITEANAAFLKAWGYPSKEEVLGRPIPDFLQNEDEVAAILAALSTTGVWEGDYTAKRKDGTTFVAHGLATAVRDEGGKVIGYQSAVQDITESKRAEEERERILNMSQDLICIAGMDGYFKYVNPAWTHILGYTSEELLSKPFLSFIHPDDHKRNDDEVTNLDRGINTQDFENRYVHKNGSIRTISWTAAPLKDANVMYCIGRDITDRKRAEKELDRLFSVSVDMIAIAGFDGYFKRVNPAWERALGHSPDHILSKPFVEFVHPEDREATIAEASKIAQGVETLRFENRYRCKDGSYRWLAWTAIPVVDEGLMYCVARDITERKRAEEALRKAVADLKRSNEELQQFAYVASHDLQEPLRAVASFTQLLSERYKGKLDKDADEFIAFAVGGANRMQTLINDLLSYSRLETRGKPPEPTDSHDALGQALANLGTAIRESVALVTNDELPKVLADEGQLVQLFQNLIGNAVKFHGKEPPRVHVSAALQGREWLFSVRDNGIGIAQEYQERIFSIFQRLHSREEYPGTGIGLALCKRIVERHGGTIRVESEPGSGSTFFFTLPKP
jgi:PAS domain S-box-containing protein